MQTQTSVAGVIALFNLKERLKNPKEREKTQRNISVGIYLFFYFAMGPFFYLINKIFFNNNPVINYHSKQSTVLFFIPQLLTSVFVPIILGLGIINRNLSNIFMSVSIYSLVATEIILGIFLAIRVYQKPKQGIFPFIKLTN